MYSEPLSQAEACETNSFINIENYKVFTDWGWYC